MLRAALRTTVRPRHHRQLVSSVLLTRTYENGSVAELKKIAKERGLSSKGNKATLITRIQEQEQHNTLQAVSSAQDPPVPAGAAQIRHASSASPTTSGSEVSGPVPGIPLAGQRTSNLASIAFTNVNLPDLSQPDPELPTPIPFYPDFYDSIHHPTPYKTGDHSTEPSIPKVLIVAGSSTHHDGGPSHNLDGRDSSDRHQHAESLSSRSRFSTPGGSILHDVAIDIGMPTSWEHGQSTESASSTKENEYSRKLDKDEVKGIWVLVGLLTGSWILGGIINGAPKKSVDEHHSH